MNEKKESNRQDQQDDKVQIVLTRRPIDEPFKIFSKHMKKRAKTFIEYQVPSAQDNLKSWITSFRGGIGLMGLILVTFIPLMLNDTVYYHTFIMAMIYSIYAASWDLLSGVSGQVSFGQAAYFGIGGYSCAYFIIYLGFDWFPSIFIGGILAILFGLLVAVPCLRFTGPYLALGTLAFSLLLFNLFHMASLSHIFFGEQGIPVPTLSIFSFKGNIITEFLIVLIIMIICIVVMLAIFNSRLGTIFKAIRDDETSTEAAGINTMRYKLYAFMISAFFAGIAGSFYVLHIGKADYNIYSSLMSFYPIIFTLVGGIALISGSVFGAYFYALTNLFLDELFDFFTQMGFFPEFFNNLPTAFISLIFSIILLILIRFTERGIMEPTIKHSKTLWDLIIGK